MQFLQNQPELFGRLEKITQLLSLDFNNSPDNSTGNNVDITFSDIFVSSADGYVPCIRLISSITFPENIEFSRVFENYVKKYYSEFFTDFRIFIFVEDLDIHILGENSILTEEFRNFIKELKNAKKNQVLKISKDDQICYYHPRNNKSALSISFKYKELSCYDGVTGYSRVISLNAIDKLEIIDAAV